MVPRWITAVLHREPWDQKKYHQLQSSKIYFIKYDENQDVDRSSKPIASSLFNINVMIDSIKIILKVDYDHASIVSFIHVKSDLVCQVW